MFFRPQEHDGYADVAELVRELEHSLASTDSEVQRGLLQGLTATDAPAPLSSGGGEMSDRYRGGVLAGRLYRRLLEERGRMDTATMLAASIYGANMAQAAVRGRFDAPSADVVLEEHLVACVRAARQGQELDEEKEQEALRWLADELAIPLDEALLARWRELRERRIARLTGEA